MAQGEKCDCGHLLREGEFTTECIMCCGDYCPCCVNDDCICRECFLEDDEYFKSIGGTDEADGMVIV